MPKKLKYAPHETHVAFHERESRKKEAEHIRVTLSQIVEALPRISQRIDALADVVERMSAERSAPPAMNAGCDTRGGVAEFTRPPLGHGRAFLEDLNAGRNHVAPGGRAPIDLAHEQALQQASGGEMYPWEPNAIRTYPHLVAVAQNVRLEKQVDRLDRMLRYLVERSDG